MKTESLKCDLSKCEQHKIENKTCIGNIHRSKRYHGMKDAVPFYIRSPMKA